MRDLRLEAGQRGDAGAQDADDGVERELRGVQGADGALDRRDERQVVVQAGDGRVVRGALRVQRRRRGREGGGGPVELRADEGLMGGGGAVILEAGSPRAGGQPGHAVFARDERGGARLEGGDAAVPGFAREGRRGAGELLLGLCGVVQLGDDVEGVVDDFLGVVGEGAGGGVFGELLVDYQEEGADRAGGVVRCRSGLLGDARCSVFGDGGEEGQVGLDVVKVDEGRVVVVGWIIYCGVGIGLLGVIVLLSDETGLHCPQDGVPQSYVFV